VSVELVLEDLKKRYGDRKVLYARDIAEIIGESPSRVQRLLRARSLPFPVIHVGRHNGVSLYAVAQWLSEGESLETASCQVSGDAQGKGRKSAERTLTPVPAGVDCHDPETNGQANGTSLVAQIMAMRHDAARFISDRLLWLNDLPRRDFQYWRSVVKHLMLAPIGSPSWVLKVVRTVSLVEQSTVQRVYDVNGLEQALSDGVACLSDDEGRVLHLTLKDSKTRKTVLEVIGQGRQQFVVIDEVGFVVGDQHAEP